MIENMEQFAADLQTLLSEAAGVPVYERSAPRDSSEALKVEPPFVVYTADTRAPADEGGEWTVDLFVDVWALGGWAVCYEVSRALDDVLSGTAHFMESGTLCCDRNGLCYQRMERDPDDERIRRMTGQYLIRFQPNLFKE
jgi:hypothetical protein